MYRKIILVLSCLVAFSASARQVITGVVTDKQTVQPVEGASVELLRMPDSSFVELSPTNAEGQFILYKADTSAAYCLRIKQLIYKTVSVPVLPKKGSMINNVGTLNLEPNTFNLKEIVVNGFKVSVTELGDRTVYGIPEGVQKTSSDGLDVLRKVPSVQVDYLNEDITVNGRSNIKIEVDGISRDKGYLKRLHPSQISKMEVITNPSGKYDSEIDAVINIVTNPAMRYGLKGMFYAGAFPISSNSNVGMMNGSLDYGLEKISYYVAANGISQNVEIGTDMTRTAGVDVLNQTSSQMVKMGMGNANFGFIYDPDEQNDINFNVAYNNVNYKVDNDTWNSHSVGGSTSLFETESNTENKNSGLTTSLFYKHKFDKKTQHGFEAELNYNTSLDNSNTTDFRNIYFTATDTTINPWQHQLTNTKVRNLYGQSNYTLPIDSLYTFNAGISGNYNRYLTDNTSTVMVVDNLDYSDLRLGGYAELSRTFSKGSIRVGSRFESSRVAFNAEQPRFYNSLLPYINGLYKFNTDNSIKLTYSRRVIRPTTDQLNPLVNVVDSQTISFGNMDLKPAYRDNFQLIYNWKLTVKKVTFNISPQAFYEYKTGLIQTVLSQNSDTQKFESKPTNISNGYEYGGALSVNSQIGKVMFNSNFRYSFYHIDRYLDQITATNRQGWSWNSFAMCPLPHDFQFMTVLNLNGPVLDGQTVTKSSAMLLVGLGKQFKNNSVLRLMVFNPQSREFFHRNSTISNNTLYQVQNTSLKKDYGVMLMYVYSFKLGNAVERQKRTSEQQTQESPVNLPINF